MVADVSCCLGQPERCPGLLSVARRQVADRERMEKTARGTKERYFPWGNQMPQKTTASFGNKQAEATGNRPGDVSPFEVFDMGGNVSEMTSDRIPKETIIRPSSRAGPSPDPLGKRSASAASSSTRMPVELPSVSDASSKRLLLKTRVEAEGRGAFRKHQVFHHRFSDKSQIPRTQSARRGTSVCVKTQSM